MWKSRYSLGFGSAPCWTKRGGAQEKKLGCQRHLRWPWDLPCAHPSLCDPPGLLGPRLRGHVGTSTSPSSQPQHSHLVIQQLLSHLDANSRSAATVRAGIVEVLSEAAVIAATGSVGKGALKGVGAGNPSRTKNCPCWEAASSFRKGQGTGGKCQKRFSSGGEISRGR